MSDDAQIEEAEFITAQVVDLDGVRIARGIPKRNRSSCAHLRMTYCPQERRVWCQDCQSTVEGFDAFMVLTEHFQRMQNAAKRLKAEAQEARAATIHLIAAKAVEKTWRGKMLPCCPHCRAGIAPEEMRSHSSVSREYEDMRRRRAAAKEPTQ